MNITKIIKRVLLAVLAVVVLIILYLAIRMFWYFPQYNANKEPASIEVSTESEEIVLMSYNIRFINPLDYDERNWFYRAHLIIDTIEEAAPGIIGFQEVTQWQYSYLVETLPGYDSIITYRDKMINSEGCPIFYNTELFTLVDKGSFWLSETPEVMSKDWDAAHYRICSYAVLIDNHSQKEFVVFNAHLDHVSDEARINGIKVVLDKIDEFGGIPAVLMGDLNAEEYTETYKSATESFLDAKYATENTMTSCTYQSWGEELDSDCIDYMMISPDDYNVNYYKVITDTFDGVYSSDHFPLVIGVTFK